MHRVHWCKRAARAHATECRENERNVAHNADRLTPGNVVCSVDRLKELWTFRDNVLETRGKKEEAGNKAFKNLVLGFLPKCTVSL